MTMRFGLLGPVEAWTGDQSGDRSGDRSADMGSPKQRAVLAVLLLNADRVVAVDAIVDAVWGEDVPRTVRKNIQVYTSRLRGLIGYGPVFAPPGYRLPVPPDALDLHRFRELVDVAREARRAGRLPEAAQGYRAAEALWRGDALADLTDIGRMGPVAAQLDEQRRQAAEEGIDVELELRRHAELLPRLAALVDRHPLHERFAAQHVVALLRCGRRTDAYAAFLRCQRILHQELGLAPGQELRRLAARLRDDTTSDPHAPAAGPPRTGSTTNGSSNGTTTGPAPVRQLPTAPDTFTGRTTELAALRGRLTRWPRHTSAVCVVTGPPGIGKSALAIHAGHELADEFPDGQLYINLCGATAGARPVATVEVLARFLRALGVGDTTIPADPDEAAALLRSHLARRRMLVLLDNAADTDQVRPLITAGPNTAVIVTARRALADLDGASHLELTPLHEQDALTLLLELADGGSGTAQPGPAKAGTDLAAAGRVLGWLGGLPLAIRIAGARLAARPSWSLSTLAERLADQQRRLTELRLGDLGVRGSLLVSYQALDDPGAARLLRLLGLLDGPDVTLPAAAALLGEPATVTQDALDELVDTHLLDEAPAGRYRLHDLVRLFARERAEAEDDPARRNDALARVLRLYLVTTLRAAAFLRPSPPITDVGAGPGVELTDRTSAVAWLEAERANLVAAVALADRPDRPDPGPLTRLGVDLAVALAAFFHARGHVHDWLTVNEHGCAMARRLSDAAAEAELLTDIAAGHYCQHRLAEAAAYLRRALPRWEAAGDRAGQARVFCMLGVLHAEAGEFDRAIDRLGHSLLLRPPDDLAGRAATQGNLGRLYTLLGRHDDAVRCLNTAAQLSRRSGWTDIEINALGNLGELHCTLGQHDTALRYLRDGLALCHEAGTTRSRAGMLRNLAKAYAGTGEPGLAIEHVRLAVREYREAEFPHGEATALHDLGTLLRAGGADGEDELRQARQIFAALGVDQQDRAGSQRRH